MKTCPKCLQSKPFSEFGSHAGKPGGLRYSCKACNRKPPRTYQCGKCEGSFSYARAGAVPNLCPTCETTHLRCFTCTEILPRESFSISTQSRTGRGYKCRACWSVYSKGAGARGKKAVFVKSRYGIDLATYEAHLLAADGVCPCCGKSGRKKMVLDHCHRTGAVRGVICSACNSGIGLLGDDVAGLRLAIAYLERVSGS